MNIGAFLKEKRLEKGLFLREVGDLVGLTESMMSHIEHGKRIPTHANKRLEAIAQVLDIDPIELNVRRRIEMGELPELCESKIQQLVNAEREVIEG